MAAVRINFASWPPWTVPIDTENGTILAGISKGLYKSIFSLLNTEYTLKLQEDMTYGALDKNGNWNGMVASMVRNETDMAGPFFISKDRATAIDFSVPLAFSQQAIISGLVNAGRDPLLILQIFTLKVWLSIILSIFVSAGVATFIYTVFPSPHKKTKREAFFRYIWAFYGTLLGKEFGGSNRWFLDNILVAASFRLLLCIWLLGPALVLMYTYQGAITSTFASEKMKPKIQSLQEMDQAKDVTPSTFKDSFPLTCVKGLENTTLAPLSKRIQENLLTPETKKWPSWLEDVADGRLALMLEVNLLKDMVGMRFKDTGKCGLVVTPIDFCPAYMSYGFRRNFRPEFQKKFNQRILWFSEGILYYRQMLASLAHYDICNQMKTRTTKALHLLDLLGAFVIFATGISMSVFVFVLEKMVNVKECKK